jgi:hypothetical protein
MHWLMIAAAVGLGALAASRGRPWIERLIQAAAPGPEAALRRETELDRRIAAWRSAEQPLERFRRLGEIVAAAHAERADPAARKLLMRFAAMQVEALPAVAEELKAAGGGRLPEIPAFGLLAEALEEQGRAAEALALCRRAEALGVRDGSRAGFAGRIKRLKAGRPEKAAGRPRAGKSGKPPSPRRRR